MDESCTTQLQRLGEVNKEFAVGMIIRRGSEVSSRMDEISFDLSRGVIARQQNSETNADSPPRSKDPKSCPVQTLADEIAAGSIASLKLFGFDRAVHLSPKDVENLCCGLDANPHSLVEVNLMGWSNQDENSVGLLLEKMF